MAQEGGVLTEAQLQALEQAKSQREAHGEIETQYPGYLGAQDTYYVGNIKGIGRIYQQTFIDTYSRVAVAKVYTEKNALIAAEMLNEQVLPFFDEQGIALLRILTDRGTAFCGKKESHAFELYLNIEDIEHTRPQAYSPQTNGICEGFHKTMKTECYDVMYRRKIYRKSDESSENSANGSIFTTVSAPFMTILLWKNALADLGKQQGFGERKAT